MLKFLQFLIFFSMKLSIQAENTQISKEFDCQSRYHSYFTERENVSLTGKVVALQTRWGYWSTMDFLLALDGSYGDSGHTRQIFVLS